MRPFISTWPYEETGQKTRTDTEEPLREYFETLGWVCYTEQVVDMCRSPTSDAHIPRWKYITVIKGLFPLVAFLFPRKSENFRLFFREEKQLRRLSQKELQLSCFYVASPLIICQDKYLKSVCSAWIKRKKGRRRHQGGRGWGNGGAWEREKNNRN